ncbi:Triacylglycerol lipase 2 [Folsomia candida]|uniref:Triacylglycerol lipase 2 n=1 Tax=Folsomia candida TaxID=158441 RepID=A0A226EKW1_FOLCA|nr:Triacylglycerol lipase 2 [Folsomia candida]
MKLEYSKLVGYLILIICSTHSTFENNNNTSPRVSYPATDHSEECTTLECAYYQRIFREESKTRGFGQSGPDLIRGNGYKLEQHNLTSRDGYIISLFQILSGKDAKEKGHSSRIPVLLHHGVIADGFEWILNKVDTALGS